MYLLLLPLLRITAVLDLYVDLVGTPTRYTPVPQPRLYYQ